MIELVVDAIDGTAAAPLLAALHREIEERYRADVVEPGSADPIFDVARPADFVEPRGTFLVALLDGAPVGCVGLRPFPVEGRPGVAELKRMYVAPEARGHGVGRALLGAITDAARDLGYSAFVLETGIRQPDAMALYESAGWTPIDSYGAYRHAEGSRCYELSLSGS